MGLSVSLLYRNRCIPAAASKECDSPSERLNADQMEDGEFVVTKNGVLVPDHPLGSQQGIVRIRSLATWHSLSFAFFLYY